MKYRLILVIIIAILIGLSVILSFFGIHDVSKELLDLVEALKRYTI